MPSMETEKKTRGRKKKQPVLEQVDAAKEFKGEVYQSQGSTNKYGAKTLDDLMGINSNPYNHPTEEDYIVYLEDLNLNELHDHAIPLSILPKSDRQAMVKLLVREYRIRTSQYFNASEIQPVSSKPISKEMLKILAEGR
jgi:hypothetical protein